MAILFGSYHASYSKLEYTWERERIHSGNSVRLWCLRDEKRASQAHSHDSLGRIRLLTCEIVHFGFSDASRYVKWDVAGQARFLVRNLA